MYVCVCEKWRGGHLNPPEHPPPPGYEPGYNDFVRDLLAFVPLSSVTILKDITQVE